MLLSRKPSPALLLVFGFCLATPVLAQVASSSIPQALAVLQNAYQALAGKTAVNDVTLTGTVERIAGSDDETGTVTYKAVSGANRLGLSLSVGTRSEIRATGASGPAGNWTGPDGISHAMASHNVMTDVGLFPALTLGTLVSSANVVLTYVGVESRNGASVVHVSASHQFPDLTGNAAAFMQHLAQVEIYFDPSTFLPVSYSFNAHPDNNALLDIPTEIRYSDYRYVGGVQIPFHVQKFVNNGLTLDLQFQNASLNTGITAAQISAQ